jgi:hypothetical protein
LNITEQGKPSTHKPPVVVLLNIWWSTKAVAQLFKRPYNP